MTDHPYQVGIIMGSQSDLTVMRSCCETLHSLHIAFEVQLVSAHRTPDWMRSYAQSAQSRGLQVIIAAAGGAAHLPGMVAAHTLLPVLGVPIAATPLQGLDALFSIVQMPKGVAVGTLAIGHAGAINAAWLAAQILALSDSQLAAQLRQRRDAMNQLAPTELTWQ